MSWEDREDNTIYKVVMNHEEQYSIWPAHRENALGWNDVGKSGPKHECLAYIKEVWTDMRPLSLRKKMEEMERGRQAGQEPTSPAALSPGRAPGRLAAPRARSGVIPYRETERQPPERWLAYREVNPRARMRMFCFPYAGGGASIYRGWARLAAGRRRGLPGPAPRPGEPAARASLRPSASR